MNKDLMDCPKCSGKAEIVGHYIKGIANRYHYFVHCVECKYRENNEYRQEGKAINAWNNNNNIK